MLMHRPSITNQLSFIIGTYTFSYHRYTPRHASFLQIPYVLGLIPALYAKSVNGLAGVPPPPKPTAVSASD